MKYDGMKSQRIIRLWRNRAKFILIYIFHFACGNEKNANVNEHWNGKVAEVSGKRKHIFDGGTKNCVDGIAL